MSMSFQRDLNPEGMEMIKEMFPDVVISDKRNFLLDNIPELKQSEMKKLANTAGQPVKFELNGIGDIKEMSDGTKYEVTAQGWRKVTDS